ncbi:MAG TPA: hypothetical protein VMY37_22840 [Thermoguttaceae bacterium]|nr:hypothetical protein [Thermoguttaceae bacterium]
MSDEAVWRARPWFLVAVLTAVLSGTSTFSAEVLLRDDFSGPCVRYEFLGASAWRMKEGACRFAAPGGECFAVANLEELGEARIEARVEVDRRLGTGYVAAGLVLFGDSDNHWRLLLVDGPSDNRYFELIERHRGVHQAQVAPPPAPTRLASKQEGDLRTWQYGETYRLTLSIAPEGITGEIREASGGGFWRETYSFASGRAVRSGRPGLNASGVEGAFRELVVEGTRPEAPGDLELARGRAGSVAIVPGESGESAERLRALLEQQGFGVTVLAWDDVRPGGLRAGQPDLVVLADARRLPATVVKAAISYLRARGKLLALGAPAFGRRLIKSPDGYVSEDRYAEVLYRAVSKRPIRFAPDGWRRSCFDPRRAAGIEALPNEGDAEGRAARAWNVTTDLEGWDTFSQPIEGAFVEGETLFCFRARGDADTPQLAIECRERDGSRWIATVELVDEWRRYVLRPRDFVYWPDSPAHRGGVGDCFKPGGATDISIGLSQSHTPQCKPGMHTFSFGDLATAADPSGEESEYQVPNVEGLCPSYTLYPLAGTSSLRPAHGVAPQIGTVPFSAAGYSAVWREGGIGFDRGRACRWVRVLDAYDATGRNRGALAWLMLGETVFPGAIWANVGLADPAALFADTPEAAVLRKTVAGVAGAMTRGCFLLEAGSRHFSYRPGETIDLGALVMNAGRNAADCAVTFDATDASGEHVFAETIPVAIPPGECREVKREWTPKGDAVSRFPFTMNSYLHCTPPADELREQSGGRREDPIDAISHRIDLLPTEPAGPEEFVRVEGSQFMLGGEPWHMLGINYRPTSQGGRPTLRMLQRELYDPEVIERDLARMESIGINTLSAVFAPEPPDPNAPGAYRDLEDFLERCRRHQMKVFYFLPWGNPLARADVEAIKRHIEAAGLGDHPAILAWELAWEPIHHLGSRERGLEFLTADWNAWIVERYGSLESAERDWDFKLKRLSRPSSPLKKGATAGLSSSAVQIRTKITAGQASSGTQVAEGLLFQRAAEKLGTPAADAAPGAAAEPAAIPERQWCIAHGPWDRAVAAFRRFFSDRVGRAYGELIRELRRFDPNHLITFRFGACGIPDQAAFAHAHSASVAKHVSFLCPEGYNLQTGGWANPTPADDLRQGGLVTLYYRFLSREKPVVWMEFGYTVNGFHKDWQTGREHVSPEELARQRAEYESFFKMFIESGARGAAPWWLPGGFRLGERSDFGVLEPDGTERPACEVLRQYLPRFAEVPDGSCIAFPGDREREPERPAITLDLDAHYADAWQLYGPKYLEAVKSGRLPQLRTEGTGGTSADCPLVAVGNTPLNGHNPPKFLNAEFGAVEVRLDDGDPWREVRPGDVVPLRRGVQLGVRASLGNTAEAAWIAPKPGHTDEPGAVFLRLTLSASGTTIDVPIAADTPYLGDAEVGPFRLPLLAHPQVTVTLQMVTTRKQSGTTDELVIPFGQKRSVTIELVP